MTTQQPKARTVEPKRVPTWLLQRIRQRLGRGSSLCHAIGPRATNPWDCDRGVRWLDHWGTVTSPEGDEVLVSEPYNLTAADLQSMLQFAARLGLRFCVRGASEWYPGETLRITFEPDPNEVIVLECKDCGRPLTWDVLRKQFDRCFRAELGEEAAEEAMPRCQKCTTNYLKRTRGGSHSSAT